MVNYVKNKRGTFVVEFNSMDEASSAGYNLWFQEDGIQVVTDGMRGAAIRPLYTSLVTAIDPYPQNSNFFVRLQNGQGMDLTWKQLLRRDIRVGDTLEYTPSAYGFQCRVLLECRPPYAVPFTLWLPVPRLTRMPPA